MVLGWLLYRVASATRRDTASSRRRRARAVGSSMRLPLVGAAVDVAVPLLLSSVDLSSAPFSDEVTGGSSSKGLDAMV